MAGFEKERRDRLDAVTSNSGASAGFRALGAATGGPARQVGNR
jgi:hypothetical protein